MDIKQKKIKIIPLELRELNELVAKYHRHHKKVQGHMLSIGASVDGQIVGGASSHSHEWLCPVCISLMLA